MTRCAVGLRWGAALCLGGWVWAGMAGPFEIGGQPPDRDRWMYPFNSRPGTRPVAPVFGTFGDEAGVDTRHGQFVMSWNTSGTVPPGLDLRRYLVRSVRVQVQVVREGSFVHDPTPDAFGTYLEPGSDGAVPDADPGRPLELFGTGFRGGFTAETFLANSPYGSSAAGGRNAHAAGFDHTGAWVDVGNNVGKSAASFAPFPTRAFATGVVDGLPAGEPVPSGATVTFDVVLADPLVLGHVRSSLQAGRLWFTLTWLGESSGLSGVPNYPDVATAENLLFDPPRIWIEGVVVGDEDTDADGLPDDWERFHFGDLARGAEDDSDRDGMKALEEWREGFSPVRKDAPRLEWVLDAGGRAGLRWPLVENRREVVEWSPDLKDWEVAEGVSDAETVGCMGWRPATTREEGTGYFRLRSGD